VRLPVAAKIIMVVPKQGWAAFFAGLLLIAIIASKMIWQDDWPLQHYDALFLFGLLLRLETWEEAWVIVLFHLTGTATEGFKTHAGSWACAFQNPECPLFSGFMYASVGNYIARVIQIFDMRFAPYPPFWTTVVLATAIYANFFAHHFLPDIRMGLFAATLVLYLRPRISFGISTRRWWMPLPVAAFLSSLFLWIAENIGAATGTWL
jgi:uncharacterized membrane protein YoaT (DUF817 family)